MDSKKGMEGKIKDYGRYVLTLLMLSFYLFLGSVITTYLRPSEYNGVLFILTMFTLTATAYFVFRYKQLQSLEQQNPE
ncbi:hypothetical protein N781_10970 [Pontibacillus halophilus JSM 076056 = DSM 19796]|uniref:YrhC-like protein n=1 Tax=Pontibacillus halophilus JSM 076056 = DSM 19796 TaxID=1385510 RepID=A0A0A5ICR7_9BACI|nr:YrhC family protein [Pontibacillus halophilus]KGX93637.1 hypothetical protein N781_10970 [Pontibacillus halophilus JSM 076056 = DSM 19796]